jgi:hypothetical protein
MYIKNIETFPKEKLFKTTKIIADWLQKNYDIPVLSMLNKDYIFLDTNSLRVALSRLPIYLRPLVKIPKCFR